MTGRKPDRADRRPLPSVIYNALTMFGGAIAGVSLGLIAFLFILETFGEEQKPYMGIIAFIVLPVFLIIGLILVAIGAWREHRRRQRGDVSRRRLPSIDLNDPRHRLAVALFTVGTVFLMVLTGFGSFKAYEYTDSDKFCGTMCHQVMGPEFTAYTNSPHARVGCVECHIGPGAEWFVRSKMSGAYQVYAVLFDKYPRPIETPIKSLRPSRDTCEQCHWPAHFYEENFVVRDYFLPDEENTHFRLDMLMKIGGGTSTYGPSSGIHWHMNINNTIEYVAIDDERHEIPWVRSRSNGGGEKTFRSTEFDFSDDDLATAEIRVMDCIDCHNRPAHVYSPPAEAVNQAMGLGRIPRDLPSAKRIAVDALEGEYETKEEALESIAQFVRSEYQDGYEDVAETRMGEIEGMIREIQTIYEHNYFPEMGANWKAFPNNIGHLNAPGCFRCHDGLHETEDGEVLSRDCNICHTLLAQEMGPEDMRVSLGGVEYHHPEDIDEAWKEMNCSECHGS